MRLHRLTLRDVKGVRQRTVDLPDSGVVVLEGPNEVGKTTMIEAFDALLAFKASSRAAQVRALQPVDRDVGPYVEAELTVGGTRIRFAKQWLRQPSTTLHVLGDRPEQLTGDAAQTRVDTLLRTHLDRTLYDALRLSQSGDGTLEPLASSRVLTQALDAAAGSQLHTEGAEALLEEVEKEYRRYFTATGRATGDYREAMTRYTQAQQDVADAHLRVEEGRQLLERQESARSGVRSTGGDVAAAAERLARAQLAGTRVEAVAEAHRAATERHDEVGELHRAARRAEDQRGRAVAEQAALARALAQVREQLQQDLEVADSRRRALQDAQDEVVRAADAVELAAERVDAARADADHLATVRELAAAEVLHAQAVELVARLCRAREALPSTQVTREQAREVQALQHRIEAMDAAHRAASPTLTVDALRGAVEVRQAAAEVRPAEGDAPTDDAPADRVDAGDSREVQLTQDTTIELPGQARLVFHLRQDAHDRVAGLERLRAQLRSTVAGLGARSLEEVQELADASDRARASLREATRDLEVLLRPVGSTLAAEAAGGSVPRELADRVAALQAQADDHLRARAGVHDLPEDQAAARVLVEEATAGLRRARQAHRQAAETAAARGAEVAALTTRLDRADGTITAESARLATVDAQLAAARLDVTDDALSAQVTELAARLEEAARARAAAAAEVDKADVDGVRARLREATEHHRRSVLAHEEALAALHSVGGQVEMAAGEGRQELYQLAVTALDDAERELQALDRRARAARHLRATLTAHRDEAHRTYVRPYTQALEELGRRVYGGDFAVTVEEDLSLAARTLTGVTVPYEELSGGAKEQLGILARLAVARLVDPAHGVPVVIDDALGYSDPERLRQMGQVLGASAQGADLQVILLTCTPDRYASVPDARTVRLTA